MNSSGQSVFFCEKCKKLLKFDSVNKERFCPNCEPENFISFKNYRRKQDRIRNGRNFEGVDDAGEIVFLNIDYFEGKCNLQFKFNGSDYKEIIKERIAWTGEQVKTSAKIEVNSQGSNNLNLSILGKYKDNRCRWCKSLRTALTAYLNIEYQKSCRFDF